MPGRKHCSVLKCDGKQPDAIMHNFPKQTSSRFFKWVAATGNKELLKISHKQIHSSQFICRKHFHQEYLMHNNRIAKVAVPTLYLPEPLEIPNIRDTSRRRSFERSRANEFLDPAVCPTFEVVCESSEEDPLISCPVQPNSGMEKLNQLCQNYEDLYGCVENEEVVTVENQEQSHLLDESFPKDKEPVSKKQKLPYQVAVANFVRLACDTLKSSRIKETEDDLDAFGRMIAMELRNIKNIALQNQVKRKIFNAIMDAQDEDRKRNDMD